MPHHRYMTERPHTGLSQHIGQVHTRSLDPHHQQVLAGASQLMPAGQKGPVGVQQPVVPVHLEPLQRSGGRHPLEERQQQLPVLGGEH